MSSCGRREGRKRRPPKRSCGAPTSQRMLAWSSTCCPPPLPPLSPPPRRLLPLLSRPPPPPSPPPPPPRRPSRLDESAGLGLSRACRRRRLRCRGGCGGGTRETRGAAVRAGSGRRSATAHCRRAGRTRPPRGRPSRRTRARRGALLAEGEYGPGLQARRSHLLVHEPQRPAGISGIISLVADRDLEPLEVRAQVVHVREGGKEGAHLSLVRGPELAVQLCVHGVARRRSRARSAAAARASARRGCCVVRYAQASPCPPNSSPTALSRPTPPPRRGGVRG